uniref:Uncharacterized protein n=1 Tax=viral metagenome TaxID=1070528 RepID=A0A6M3KDM5_9ZZZZ
MTLTKREALVICRELWEWLRDHPRRRKDDWPEWGKYGRMNSNCPACEYCEQQDLHCWECILPWPDGNCCAPASPFTAWRDGKDSGQGMVDLCNQTLRKLDREEGMERGTHHTQSETTLYVADVGVVIVKQNFHPLPTRNISTHEIKVCKHRDDMGGYGEELFRGTLPELLDRLGN